MKTTFILPLILTTLMSAQTPAAPKPVDKPVPPPAPKVEPEKPIPVIPSEDKIKLMKLSIQLNDVLSEEKDLQLSWLKDQAKAEKLNAQGLELEKQVLTKLGLDPTKYTTRVVEGDEVILKSGK